MNLISIIKPYTDKIRKMIFGEQERNTIADSIDKIANIVEDYDHVLNKKIDIGINNYLSEELPEGLSPVVKEWMDDHPEQIDGRITELLDDFWDKTISGGVTPIIYDWMAEHPEATTTVTPGSIEDRHLSDFLRKHIANYYVTPEMYGAVGDGVTDDSEAIQMAISSGYPVIFSAPKYYIAETIGIYSPHMDDEDTSTRTRDFVTILDATNSEIIYDGTDEAFVITGCHSKTIRFGKITATNGTGIMLSSENASTSIQYLNIYFSEIRAKTCIYGFATSSDKIDPETGDVVKDNGWVNEICFHGGRLAGIATGTGLVIEPGTMVKIRDVGGAGTGYLNKWSFYNVGFERAKYANRRDVTAFDIDSISGLFICNARWREATVGYDLFLKTTGKCEHILIIGTDPIGDYYCDLSADTSGTILMRSTDSKDYRATRFAAIQYGRIYSIDPYSRRVLHSDHAYVYNNGAWGESAEDVTIDFNDPYYTHAGGWVNYGYKNTFSNTPFTADNPFYREAAYGDGQGDNAIRQPNFNLDVYAVQSYLLVQCFEVPMTGAKYTRTYDATNKTFGAFRCVQKGVYTYTGMTEETSSYRRYDADNYKAPGIYLMENNNDVSNLPSGTNNAGTLDVDIMPGGVKQTFTQRSGVAYSRTYHNGTWYEWKAITS